MAAGGKESAAVRSVFGAMPGGGKTLPVRTSPAKRKLSRLPRHSISPKAWSNCLPRKGPRSFSSFNRRF